MAVGDRMPQIASFACAATYPAPDPQTLQATVLRPHKAFPEARAKMAG
jgi:hypothetical protein